MKLLSVIIAISILFPLTASCQQIVSLPAKMSPQTHAEIIESLLKYQINAEEPHLPTATVINHLNSPVYVFDRIYGYKIVNDTLKLLYVGGRYPTQLLTVIIKGKKLNEELAYLKNGVSHFSGTAFMYEGKPAIIITSSLQLGIQLQI